MTPITYQGTRVSDAIRSYTSRAAAAAICLALVSTRALWAGFVSHEENSCSYSARSASVRRAAFRGDMSAFFLVARGGRTDERERLRARHRIAVRPSRHARAAV